MESTRIEPVSDRVITPTYLIHTKQNTGQTNKNDAPPQPREGHSFLPIIHHS
jgi:hypothetical protein